MQNFLTEKEVARQISVSLASLRRWRLEKRGPRFVKLGALIHTAPRISSDGWTVCQPEGVRLRVQKLTFGSRRDDRRTRVVLAGKAIKVDDVRRSIERHGELDRGKRKQRAGRERRKERNNMALSKRGGVWWFEFVFSGERIRESTKQGNRRTAEQIESARRTQMAKGEVGIKHRKPH